MIISYHAHNPRRLSKEMIGRPKDFVHCTYVDKADAKVGFDTEVGEGKLPKEWLISVVYV